MKKLLAILLTLTMVVGLAGIAFAADITLTYDANGGTAVPDALTSGTSKTLRTSGATHDADEDGNAIVIIGWTETADPKIYAAGDTLSADHYYADGAVIEIDEPVTLYALWGLDADGDGTADVLQSALGTPSTITYDANGGDGAPKSVTIYSTSYTISTTEPTKTGFKFMGWVAGTSAPADIDKAGEPAASKALVTTALQSGDTDTISGDTTYYALWAEDANGNDTADYDDTQYTVIYDMNTTPGVGFDGIVRPVTTTGSLSDDTTYVYDTTGDISEKVPSNNKASIYDEVKDETVPLAFIGWSMTQNPKAIRTSEPYTSVETIIFTDTGLNGFTVDDTADPKTVTVFAIWGVDTDEDGIADVVDDDANKGTGADTIKITQNPTNGTAGIETYEAFKIFDVTKTSDVTEPVTDDTTIGATITSADTGFAYTISADSKWLPVLQGSGNTWVDLTLTADGNYQVTWKDGVDADETNAKAFAEWLLANKPADAPSETFTTGQTLHTDPGYYLITSSLGTNLILATTNIDINTKNEYPSTQKDTPSDNSYTVGQQVPFTITVSLPATVDYTKPVVIHDTMDAHLKLKADSFSIDNTNVIGTLNANPTDGCTFEYTLNINGLAPAAGSTPTKIDIVVSYTAELTSDDGEDVLTLADTEYVNKEYVEYSGYKTPEDDAKVKTDDWTLIKTFDDAAQPDFEATFIVVTDPTDETTALHFILDSTGYLLKDTDDAAVDGDTIITVKGTADGVNIRGFACGANDTNTYYLIEKSTAAGYNMLKEPVKVTLNSDNTFTVNNQTGTELPSTGSIGVYPFYIGGGLMAVGAGVVLVTRKRMGKEEEEEK